jgi:PKD repeat protein
MKLYRYIVIISAFLLFIQFDVKAQIETRLATNCATAQIEIPVIVKNLELIKAFELQLKFDSTLLQLDTSLHHHPDFVSNNFGINVESSNDTIFINYSGDGVNLDEGLLLSLVFSERAEGTAAFSWIEANCKYTNALNLQIDSDYSVDSNIELPFSTDVEFDFEQFQIGCRDDSENGGCKAQAVVRLLGGEKPYQYHWYDRFNQKDSIAHGLCEDPITIVVTDASGCKYADLFDPVVYPAIHPDDIDDFVIEYSPEEIFITRPLVEFSINPGGTSIEKYEWNFNDGSDNKYTQYVDHVYDTVGNYMVQLTTENIDGCDTTISETIEIKELNFCIPNVFTPNGDGVNDTWIFNLITSGSGGSSGDDDLKATGLLDEEKCSGEDLIFADHFKSTELVVFNRNGNRVFDCTNCTDNWDGGGLPDGVYFYVFTWVGEYSNGQEQGNVTILGSSN